MNKVNKTKWDDWHWQIQNAVTDISKITFPIDDTTQITKVTNTYPLRATPYYLSLIDKENKNDPILKQILPNINEITDSGEDDPIREDSFYKLPRLIRHYNDRALIIANNFCPVNCRFCMRKRKWRDETFFISNEEIINSINYIQENSEIKDVLISGGEPLLLDDETIDFILTKLKKIKHLQIIRFGTRVPVTLPMRLTEKLGKILHKHKSVYFNTHFNHPNEITRTVKERVELMSSYGIIWGNQSVLLKGINDNYKILLDLNYRLLAIGIKPYYIFHADPVKGTNHFRIPLEKSLEIIRELRNYSGMASPKFALDLPDGKGKIILEPNSKIIKKENYYLIEDNNGNLVKYY